LENNIRQITHKSLFIREWDILSELTLKFIDKKNTDNFLKIAERIGTLLSREVNVNSKTIYTQESDSSIEIPKQGTNFGCIIDNNSIVLANWLYDLSSIEGKHLIHFLLSKEVFRNILFDSYLPNTIFKNFFEILLNCITVLWCIKDLSLISYYDRNVGFISQRMIYGFDKADILLWERRFTNLYFSEISIKEFFEKIYSLSQKMIYNNLSFENLQITFNQFIDLYEPRLEHPLFPTHMKERHLNILAKILHLGYKDTSARKIGEYFHRKHDVINYAFKEMTNLYLLYWLPRVNYQALKLYPSTFQLLISDKSSKDELLKIFHKNHYIFNLYESTSKNNQLIYASFQSPLIIQNQLEELFDRYMKKNKITDYFFQSPKRRTIFGTIITDKITPTKNMYTQLIVEPETFPIKTFTFLDEIIEIDYTKKTKKVFFAEEVLGFLASLNARFLPQGMYDFRIVEFVELCKKFNVDINQTKDVMSYINKMEHRCLRLGLLDYKLILWVKSNHAKSLNFELFVNPEDSRVDTLINNLKSFATLSKTEFKDRVVLTFQGISYDKHLVDFIKSQISSYNIEFIFNEFTRNIDFQRCLCLNKLYDYDNFRWKF